jgi:tetratricopeptide (TPR) repeat protein
MKENEIDIFVKETKGKQIRSVILFADIMNAAEISNNTSTIEYAYILEQFHSCAEKIIRFLKLHIYQDTVFELDKRGDQICLILHSYDVTKNETEENVIKRDVTNAILFAVAIKLLWRTSDYNKNRIDQDLFPRDIGIGINEGLIYFCNTKTGNNKSEGYSINLAKRIESESRNGKKSKILVSGSAKFWSEKAELPVDFSEHNIKDPIKGISTDFYLYEISEIKAGIFTYINDLANVFEFSSMALDKYERLYKKNPNDFWTRFLIYFKNNCIAKDQQEIAKMNDDKSDGSIEYLIAEIARFMNIGNFDQIIASCTKLIELSPNNAITYNNRAYAFNKKGLFEDAINDFTKYIELAPKDSIGYFNRGLMYHQIKLDDKAIIDFSKAIDLNPNNWSIYCSRGTSFVEKGMDKEAMDDYDKSILIDANAYISYNNRGNLFFARKENDKALKDYTTTIRISPTYKIAYVNRANVLAKQSRFEDAIADIARAIEMDSNFVEAYNFRGIIYYIMKKYDDSLNDFNKALSLKAENQIKSGIYNNRGYLFIDLNKIESAINDFKLAIGLKPDRADAFCGLAICDYKNGDIDNAKIYYKKAIELNPNYSISADKLIGEGKVYSEEVIEAIDKIIQLSI